MFSLKSVPRLQKIEYLCIRTPNSITEGVRTNHTDDSLVTRTGYALLRTMTLKHKHIGTIVRQLIFKPHEYNLFQRAKLENSKQKTIEKMKENTSLGEFLTYLILLSVEFTEKLTYTKIRKTVFGFLPLFPRERTEGQNYFRQRDKKVSRWRTRSPKGSRPNGHKSYKLQSDVLPKRAPRPCLHTGALTGLPLERVDFGMGNYLTRGAVPQPPG